MCNKDKWTYSALWRFIGREFMPAVSFFLAVLFFVILLCIIGHLFFKVKT